MDKFLYITDIHYGAKPIARKDNYNQSILNKLEWVLKLARKNGCVVLIGGDLFDTPKIKFLELNTIVEMLSKYVDVEIHCIHGNEGHDGFESVSPLSLVKMTGLISNENKYKDFEHTRVIFGNHGFDFMEVPLLISNDKKNILMTHLTITQKPVIFDHILMKDFWTPADAVLVAHYHPYQGIVTENDTLFVAPGALARRKKVSHDMTRQPKAVYLTVDGVKGIRTREIDIPCEMDVWSEKISIDISDDLLYSELNKEVDNMKQIIDNRNSFLNIEDLMSVYAKAVGTDEDIVNICKDRLKGI